MQRFALVERERERQLIAATGAHVRDAVQSGGALERGRPRPAVEGPRSRFDSPLCVLAIALGHRAEVLTTGWTRSTRLGAAVGRAPVAVDEHARHLGDNRGALKLRRTHRWPPG